MTAASDIVITREGGAEGRYVALLGGLSSVLTFTRIKRGGAI